MIRRRTSCMVIPLLLCVASLIARPAPVVHAGIMNTKHNLSNTGPGDIRAIDEDRICVFCHTPHNAYPRTPLWNKNLQPVNYTPYGSSTMNATPKLPTGPSRLCLSCHDGTIALGELMQPSSMVAMTVAGGMPADRTSYLGTSLASDHPVSFSYFQSLANLEISPILPQQLLFYNNGVVHCTTCHNPHDNLYRKFLAVNNEGSGLCILCHKKTGWELSSHSTELNTWTGTAPNPWPRTGAGTDFGWTTVKQNACENCHAPHQAAGDKRLLNCYTDLGRCIPYSEEGTCYPCHNGNMTPATKNIQAQFSKMSRHTVEAAAGMHDPRENPRQITGHVECVDCHNTHTANKITAAAPAVSGRIAGVSGIAIDDIVVQTASYEYEICFKCHASASAQSLFPPLPRYAKEVNTRLAFQTTNASFHPVAGAGASSDVPSLIPPLSATSRIYCTDCHSDESVTNGGSGSRGPHGSQYSPILKLQYKTTYDFLYSANNFALCYGCHYETSILSDNTFQKNSVSGKGGHSGHLGAPVYAPCSACHDPHGVKDDGGLTGSHKRLINFDTRHVSTLPAWVYSVPIFSGSGNRAGNCALVCHDASGVLKTHDGSTTYSYGGAAAFGPGVIQMHW